MKLFLRIAFIPVTAFFLARILYTIEFNLFTLVGFYIGYESAIYETLEFFQFVFPTIFVFWIIAQLLFELLANWRKDFASSRVIKNLRYAPIAALIFSMFVVILFDIGMIEYSKWRINNYVYNSADAIEKPDFYLHVDDRGWCGNGHSARENSLYFKTAGTGINDKNPHIRARALLMTNDVKDWLNGSDERFDMFLANACRDSDEIMKNTAENLLKDRSSNCQIYLLSK